MAIAKQVSKSKPVCKVTFVLSSDVVADAKDVALLGEFNGWASEAATKLKKQNVFDDFIAAAEYLIAKKYTSPGKLAIHGVSPFKKSFYVFCMNRVLYLHPRYVYEDLMTIAGDPGTRPG